MEANHPDRIACPLDVERAVPRPAGPSLLHRGADVSRETDPAGPSEGGGAFGCGAVRSASGLLARTFVSLPCRLGLFHVKQSQLPRRGGRARGIDDAKYRAKRSFAAIPEPPPSALQMSGPAVRPKQNNGGPALLLSGHYPRRKVSGLRQPSPFRARQQSPGDGGMKGSGNDAEPSPQLGRSQSSAQVHVRRQENSSPGPQNHMSPPPVRRQHPATVHAMFH